MSNSILHVPVLADCKMRLDEADTAGTLITSRVAKVGFLS
jgi:hypothetical protein